MVQKLQQELAAKNLYIEQLNREVKSASDEMRKNVISSALQEAQNHANELQSQIDKIVQAEAEATALAEAEAKAQSKAAKKSKAVEPEVTE
jgi:hypothetical protein